MITRISHSGTRGAVFSDCERYRFLLWRRFHTHEAHAKRWLTFALLNPSTANESANDPTVERCQRRAIDWGFDGLYVVNLFALRSTDPAMLRKVQEPIGLPQNDITILETAQSSELVIAGWGAHGVLMDRGKRVRESLTNAGVKLHYLKLSKDEFPVHPLYINLSQEPKLWQ